MELLLGPLESLCGLGMLAALLSSIGHLSFVVVSCHGALTGHFTSIKILLQGGRHAWDGLNAAMPELVDLLLVVSSLLLLPKQVVVLSLGELGRPVISAGRSDDHGLRYERHSRVGGHCGGRVNDVALALGRERRAHAAGVVLGRSVVVEGEGSDGL